MAGCTFAEFSYALKKLHSSQPTNQTKAARELTGRSNKEPQLASAFTREEAAAGCADLDDEEDFAGQCMLSAAACNQQPAASATAALCTCQHLALEIYANHGAALLVAPGKVHRHIHTHMS